MDVFNFRPKLVADYDAFTPNFTLRLVLNAWDSAEQGRGAA